jgi:serine/threonine protein kinase/tetratricopeptide (TPR) repeat protein
MNDESLFHQALERSAQERAAFLDEACAGDEPLRWRVEALLQAHDNPGSFLQAPAVQLSETTDSNPRDDGGPNIGPETAPGEVSGKVVGPYQLLQQIGEGGMGAVWMAEQTHPVHRKVALKLIKSGMDSRQVIARFEAERQALALMDHPNIARVLDAGATETGRPYFVMELVKGVPITRYCDEHHLTPRERLELFVPVCQAVQHAHQKGIIHRDLKPSNVMVCLYDGQPAPKVIDFGIAKAAGPRLTEKTLFTELGQVVGTLEYMSPEQAELNQLDIDTRSDIYSLGVLLYELLTGTTPLERKRFQAVAFLEVLRLIREEESPRPSTRLSTSEGQLGIAANRGLEPKKLSGLMRGELDWIVMKTLEKDRNHRYETANGLALDVQRYLADEPVQACPPNASYRLKKFLRRNKGPVLAVSLVVLALVGGVIGATWGLIRATAAEARALQERDDKEEARKLAVASALEARQSAEAERLAKDAERRQRKLAEAARDRAANTLDAMTSDVAPDALTQQQVITPKQREFLTGALEFYRELLKETANDEATRKRLAAAAFRVADIEHALGRLNEAALMIRQARDLYADLATEFPFPKYRTELAKCHNNLGNLLRRLRRRQEAEIEHQAAYAFRKQLAAANPNDPECRRELASTHNSLGAVLWDWKKFDEAEIEYRAAIAIQENLAAEDPKVLIYREQLARSRHNLGLLFFFSGLGKPEKAAVEFRAAIVLRQELSRENPKDPGYRDGLALSHHNLGDVLRRLKKADQAETEFRVAIALLNQLAKEFPSAPGYRLHLAGSIYRLGNVLHYKKPEQAEIEYRTAIRIQQEVIDELPSVGSVYHDELGHSRDALANLLLAADKRDQAESELRAAVGNVNNAVEFSTDPAYRRHLAELHTKLGDVLRDGGKQDPAMTEYGAALDLRKQLLREDPEDLTNRQHLATAYVSLGNLLAAANKWPQAESEFRAALAQQKIVVDKLPTKSEPVADLGKILVNLGHAAAIGGRRNDALGWYEQGIALLAPQLEKEPGLATAREALFHGHEGRALTFDELKRYEDAVKDWARALELAPTSRKAVCQLRLMCSRAHAGQWAPALKDADALAKNDTKDFLYDCACVYALAHAGTKDDKQAVRAVELLRRAAAKGYRDVATVKQDSDLDSVRARDDFRQFLAEMEKTQAPRPPE